VRTRDRCANKRPSLLGINIRVERHKSGELRMNPAVHAIEADLRILASCYQQNHSANHSYTAHNGRQRNGFVLLLCRLNWADVQ
jgi:hypothetical protein